MNQSRDLLAGCKENTSTLVALGPAILEVLEELLERAVGFCAQYLSGIKEPATWMTGSLYLQLRLLGPWTRRASPTICCLPAAYGLCPLDLWY